MNESIEESEFSAGNEVVREATEAAVGCCEQTLEKGKNYVRSNPIPTILGALAVGVAVGMLIPRCEEEPPVSRLTGRLDELKDLLSSLGGKVTATAEDQYDGLTSAIGATIKKAKKRFNLP